MLLSSENFKRGFRRREGGVTRALERQTGKIPSGLFMWAAGISIAASLASMVSGRKQTSLFIGQWAPTLLIIGLYNRLMRRLGTD